LVAGCIPENSRLGGKEEGEFTSKGEEWRGRARDGRSDDLVESFQPSGVKA
jgi:hypothetical protein